MEEETALTQSVVITSDSTCDLSQELLDRYDIPVIPLTITLGEDTFLDGSNFTPLDMYARYQQDGTLPKTSAPSVQEFLDFFSQFTEKGCEVVHLDISSELSNTYNAACMAAEELGHVHVVDSRMLSTGVGLLAIEGAECRDRGMGAQMLGNLLQGSDQLRSGYPPVHVEGRALLGGFGAGGQPALAEARPGDEGRQARRL